MIRSVGHQHTRAWHHAHRRRAHWGWFIMLVIALAALGLAFLGYFSQVAFLPLASSLALTTARLVAAYLIALVLGVGLGLFIAWSPLSDALFPVFDILQNIPSFALIPVFIYFLGFSNVMIVVFAVSSIIWPILFAVLTASKNAHRDLNDAAAIFGARGFRRVSDYLAPLSFPAILTGSVVGIAIGWEAVIGAEIIADTSGFGAFIKNAGTSGISPATIAGTLGILAIVFVVNRLLWAPLLAESAKKYSE